MTVIVSCSKCHRTVQVELETRSKVDPICGHGTILNPSHRKANTMQCACGYYID